MPNIEFETEIEIYDADGELIEIIEAEVEAHVEAFCPGQYSGPPEYCYPDEGGGVDEISIKAYGYDIYDRLSKEELESITEEAEKMAASEAKEARYEDRWDDDY